jgi:protein involved in polysaccharide export with SLBB domain
MKTPMASVESHKTRGTLSVTLCILAVFTAPVFSQIPYYPPPPPLPPPPTQAPMAVPTAQPQIAPIVTPIPMASEAIPREESNGQSTASGLSSMEALDDSVPLRDGDRISFRVIEDQDEAVPRLVTDTGEVDFPYVGRMKVSGRTCKAVAYDLKKLLEVDYYKRATVIVGLDSIFVPPPTPIIPDAPKMAWIVGQVRQVGPIELRKDQHLTVSQMILQAGGFGDFADQRRVKLIHKGHSGNSSPSVSNQEGEIIDVKAVYEGKSNIDPEVDPNDLVVVPKKAFNY